MTTWDDKPNDYEHALVIIERLRAALLDIMTTASDAVIRDRAREALKD